MIEVIKLRDGAVCFTPREDGGMLLELNDPELIKYGYRIDLTSEEWAQAVMETRIPIITYTGHSIGSVVSSLTQGECAMSQKMQAMECPNCDNCDDCSGCAHCENCGCCCDCCKCDGCKDCNGCVRCVNCTNCTNCTDCKDCTDCHNQTGLTGQTGVGK